MYYHLIYLHKQKVSERRNIHTEQLELLHVKYAKRCRNITTLVLGPRVGPFPFFRV